MAGNLPVTDTPEPLRAAPFWRRFGALVLDYVFLCVPAGLLHPTLFGSSVEKALSSLTAEIVAPGTGELMPAIVALFLSTLFGLVLMDVYYIFFEYRMGATPGKRILGLKVVSLKGPSLTLGQCIWREVFRHIDVSFVLPGLLCVVVTEDHQRLGDLVAKTQVVDARSPAPRP